MQCRLPLPTAAHLRLTEGTVATFRKEYALTLLMSIGGGECFVQGIINPAPEIPLAIEAFPKVPFARLRAVAAHEISVEWVVADPWPFKHYYIPHLRPEK